MTLTTSSHFGARPFAILFAATLTLALWSPTLSGPLQPNGAAATVPAAAADHIVFAAASTAPVLM